MGTKKHSNLDDMSGSPAFVKEAHVKADRAKARGEKLETTGQKATKTTGNGKTR